MKRVFSYLAFLGSFIIFLLFLIFFLLFPIQFCLSEEGKVNGSPFKEAVSFFEHGDTDRAIEIMKSVVTADSRNADAYDQLGYFFLKKTQFDDSLDAFAAALRINAALRTSKTGMGLALLKKGDLKGAETILNEALSLNPYPALTHYALGLVYDKAGDYEKSVHHFKEGIKTYKVGKK